MSDKILSGIGIATVVVLFVFVSIIVYQAGYFSPPPPPGHHIDIARIYSGIDSNGNDIHIIMCFVTYDGTRPPCEYHFANGTRVISETSLRILPYAELAQCGMGTLINRDGYCGVTSKIDCSLLENIPIPEGSIRGMPDSCVSTSYARSAINNYTR